MDESFIVAGRPTGRASRENGVVRAYVGPARPPRVAEFNDAAALERELAHGDVAAAC